MAINKYNPIYRLQKWLDSVPGQTFMNYAYSWGAAVVILGALFKLTHLPGANLWLFLGMGTEVFVFFIAGFDRPFDKNPEGVDIKTEEEYEAEVAAEYGETTGGAVVVGGGVIGGGVIGGAVNPGVVAGDASVAQEATSAEHTTGGNGPIVIGGINGPMTPAPAVTQETAEAMEEATTTYVDRLNDLNELLLKVAAQSERLTKDSEEMENLNRTLTGIAKIYEMHLKSASQLIGTQDEINDKSRHMSEQIEQLNQIYARLIEAMTVNAGAQTRA